MSLRVDLPYEQWLPTKETLHRFAQIVGKVRLAHSPRRNHWWNVPFHVTGSGITTRPMGSNPVFAIDLDFIEHRAVIATTEGSRRSFPLEGQSVASFHAALVASQARRVRFITSGTPSTSPRRGSRTRSSSMSRRPTR
ncbi:DUF5996 family protein [Microbacterium sp. ARD31]|uniref:DUF5996 family protein n=1 Tax=Microbacterium sp. ARD31 TaxID=2962576 RepID=UPI0037C66EBA